MCACPTNSGPERANAVGDEHLRKRHIPNMCTARKTIPGLKLINQLQQQL